MEEEKINSDKKYPLLNIRSEYIMKKVFNLLDLNRLLILIKPSKLYQKKLNKDINSYKDEYLKIVIDIIPVKSNLVSFINDNIIKDNYHFYINDKKEEFNRNYLLRMDNAKKIRIVIDKNEKSLKGIFQNCVYLKKITFTKFNRSDIDDMSYLFDGCDGLEEIVFSKFKTSCVERME